MLFRTATGLLLVAALMLNLAMVMLPTVFNAVSGLVWSTVSIVSSATAARRETRATTAAALRHDADDLARTRARLITTETDLETARARIATKDGENRRLVGERDRLGQRLASADKELDASRQRLATLGSENSRLQASARNSKVQLDILVAQHSSSSAEARTITRRMQDRSIRMVSRNTASTFIETLPFVGSVTVFGTLAWDVHDTCQLLKDLHELQTKLSLSAMSRGDIESGWCGLSAEEILGRLVGTASAEERACVLARVQTQTIDPPECAAFPFELPDYRDPLDESPPAAILPPEYSFD